ncbi:2-keto-4-pentenoate hydratase [Rhodococcus wratislaviensis]|uniref:Putative 2-hydroxypenta-2,4-dienoate hydratase n=1 Tax=Rhodococcus wratislaviensis NBRC 100605 TaxID=1219028 RepID=X0PZE9_RHOWR|nr:2-oxo-hepta-3-ene-1,7-dioic acid hydratase [Rhodococcus wratislaviensis]GAF49039.1 putative 2-hydroxypenta-2,4-dienoate hydratase [Rhodococcus wratislaviensis NBRC 100605]
MQSESYTPVHDQTGRRRDLVTLAQRLEDARVRQMPVEVSATDQAIDQDTAYLVQRMGRTLRTDSGDRLTGYKIGLTSPTAQNQFSAQEPIRGYLLADPITSREKVALTGLLEPKLEVEIAFLFNDTVEGATVTPKEILAATQEIALSLEIVDSRWAGGARNLGMLIADNANAARVVLGPRVAPTDVQLSSIEVELTAGTSSQTGRGTNVMGSPVEALVWLAAHLARHGERIEAGQVVMSGTLTAPIRVSPGQDITADFGPLGRLHTTFDA